jgi:hypothetical protein
MFPLDKTNTFTPNARLFRNCGLQCIRTHTREGDTKNMKQCALSVTLYVEWISYFKNHFNLLLLIREVISVCKGEKVSKSIN